MAESTTCYTFPVRTGGIFYFPWHRHQIEGTDGSSERHWQSGVNGIVKVPKRSYRSGIRTLDHPFDDGDSKRMSNVGENEDSRTRKAHTSEEIAKGSHHKFLTDHACNRHYFYIVERGSSVVECRTRNQVSPGSNPSLLPFRRLGIFVLSIDAPVHSAV